MATKKAHNAETQSILGYFAELPGPRRDSENRRHRLIDIIAIAILATICGAERFTEPESWEGRREFPRRGPLSRLCSDLAATLLALATTIALTRRWAFAITLAWPSNIQGTIDFLGAIYEGNIVTYLDPRALGAAFYIHTAVAPPLLVAHIMSFWLLLTKDPGKGMST